LKVLQSLSEEELEDLLTYLEVESSKYLESILPPKTDFSVLISIKRVSEGVDVSIEVMIRGRLANYSEEAKMAMNYAKRKLIEWLENYIQKRASSS